MDMNRSYVRDDKTYEERQASTILKHIQDGSYDYILDMHTTSAQTEGFLICSNLSPAVRAVVGASTIRKIVIMPRHVSKNALIGQLDNAVSVEYNEVEAERSATLDELTACIRNLVNDASSTPLGREVFYVTGFIDNGEDICGVDNFQKTSAGYYPILVGEKSYTDYQGFKADKSLVLHL